MSPELDDMRQMITDLQSQLAFQEDALRSLDDAMGQQQQEILVLRQQLKLLKQRQEEQAARADGSAMDEAPAQEKPPHY